MGGGFYEQIHLVLVLSPSLQFSGLEQARRSYHAPRPWPARDGQSAQQLRPEIALPWAPRAPLWEVCALLAASKLGMGPRSILLLLLLLIRAARPGAQEPSRQQGSCAAMGSTKSGSTECVKSESQPQLSGEQRTQTQRPDFRWRHIFSWGHASTPGRGGFGGSDPVLGRH